MSTRKITDFSESLNKIRLHLPAYLKSHGYDVSNGHKIKCLSPDHDDRTPSMSLFEAEQGYPLIRCHGCGTTMDIFNVAHILEDKPSMGPGFISDTVSYLAEKYNVEVAYRNLSEDEIYELSMYQAYQAVAKYIVVQNDFNELQLTEMDKRKITPEFAHKYGIGICNNVDAMREHLVKLGFSNTFIDEVDLGNHNLFNKNNLLYTIYDDYGRPVAFMGRNLIYDGVVNEETGKFINGPKFIGSKSTLRKNIYKKNERLYLLNIAKKTNKPIYIVEGNSDAVSLHINGVTNAVAICGLGLSDLHMDTLRKNGCYDIYICLDNDSAGITKARKILDEALKSIHDIRVKFVFLPELEDEDGKPIKCDPDEFIRHNGVEAFLELEKVDPFTWRLEQFEEDQDADNEYIASSMIPIIISEPSALRREKMIQHLSLYTGFSDKSIRDEIQKIENAENSRIKASKEAIISKLNNALQQGRLDPEMLLSDALSSLHEVNKAANASILDTSTRINNMLAIKDYEEDESFVSSISVGDDMQAFSASIDGDLSGKVIYIGGASNVGKTAKLVNLMWRMAMFNDSICIPFVSIDDSAKEILPRLACFDAAYEAYTEGRLDILNVLNINKFAKPNLYKDTIQYNLIMEARERFFKKLLEYGREDKFMLFDSTDGRSLSFVESLMRHYREKYPSRRLVLFLDNFHLLQLDSEIDGREKYKAISHELKAMCVKYEATVISTVEYTKMPPEQKPNNNNIAESVSLVYDSNLIWHGFNELHGLREKALAFFHDDYGNKYPLIEFAAGKNKISGFKGNAYYRFYPDKSLYVEVSEDSFESIKESNKRLGKLEEACTED